MKEEETVFVYWNEIKEPDSCVYGLQVDSSRLSPTLLWTSTQALSSRPPSPPDLLLRTSAFA